LPAAARKRSPATQLSEPGWISRRPAQHLSDLRTRERNRRSAVIAATSYSSLRLATTSDAEERSSRPADPSAPNRRTHVPIVQMLTFAPSAAPLGHHPDRQHDAPSARAA